MTRRGGKKWEEEDEEEEYDEEEEEEEEEEEGEEEEEKIGNDGHMNPCDDVVYMFWYSPWTWRKHWENRNQKI